MKKIKENKKIDEKIVDEMLLHENKCTIQQKIDKYECVICMQEQENNICILDCKHSFCAKCFAVYFRYNNVCPMCRNQVCISPKPEKEAMPRETMIELIENEFTTLYPERNDKTLDQYIKQEIEDYIIDNRDIDTIVNKLETEIISFARDVSQRIIEWYSV